jgi:hypothetical protein
MHQRPTPTRAGRRVRVVTEGAWWEEAWLHAARLLLDDDAHRSACDRRLGAEAVERADAGDLRWPGYLGSEYRPGGLLVAATVHREFASGSPPLPPEARDRLVRSTRDWKHHQIRDDEWLADLRAVYSAGLERHWAVGKILRALGSRIGLRVAEIAYVNAARCQVVEDAPQLEALAAIKKGVVSLCSRAYPLAELVQVIRPGAIVVTKGTFDLASATLPRDVPTFVVDQRKMWLCLRYIDSTGLLPPQSRIDQWAPALGRVLTAG